MLVIAVDTAASKQKEGLRGLTIAKDAQFIYNLGDVYANVLNAFTYSGSDGKRQFKTVLQKFE